MPQRLRHSAACRCARSYQGPEDSSTSPIVSTVWTCKPLLAYRERVVDVFKALADPTRRTILDELTDRDGQTLFEICGRLTTMHGLGSSRQAISQHLEVLEAAGLVETTREGRCKFHFVNTRPLEPIVKRWLKMPAREASREENR
jgi:DNA-binding transcriptional ArsR family regulator